MNGCIYRTKYGECTIPNRSMEYGPLCRSDCTDKHPSNADRIRAMTDEELAEFLNSNAWYRVIKGAAFTNETWTLDWLKQEATK